MNFVLPLVLVSKSYQTTTLCFPIRNLDVTMRSLTKVILYSRYQLSLIIWLLTDSMSLSLKFLTELEEVLNYLSHLVMSPVFYVRKYNSHCYLFPAATNDVQRAMAVASGPGEIRVDGKFIEDTTAEGCFIVLQSEERAPDVFIALPLPDDARTTPSSTIDSIPPSTYTMLVYDLEQDGLPNTHLAFKNESNTVTVDDGKSFNSVVIIATSYSITGPKTTQS